MSFWTRLLDTSDFPPRWNCGDWTEGHGWLHILSDLGVWSAYFAIPCILAVFVARRKDLPFRGIFTLFVAFILLCGMTHLMEAIIFWWPAYRLAGVIKLLTAVVSWATVFALIPIVPRVLAMRSPEELEREITRRQAAEEALQRTNEELESRVVSRTRELNEANAVLQNEREWFRTTLSSIGDAVLTTDRSGHVTMLNPVAQSITGWSEEDALGMELGSVLQLIQEDTRAIADNPAIRSLETGRVVTMANHTLLIAKDGSEIPIEDSAAPIRDEHGVTLGAVLIFREISERRRAEAALKQSQRLYSDLYENAPDLMCSVDVQTGHVVQCNETFLRTLGYSQEEIIDRPILDRYHPDSWEDAQALLRSFAETGEIRNANLQVLDKDGRVFDVSLNATAVRDREGRIVRTRSVWRDVTDLKRTERALMQSEARLGFVLSATGIGLWMNELPLDQLNWDARTKELFFVPPEAEPTAELFWSRIHPDDREPTRRAVEAALQEASLYERDHRAVDPETGESRWIHSAGMPVLDGHGVPVRFDGLNYDITHRKENEEALRQIAAKLSEADRRKDEFLATLAHELRNPLAPIRTGLEILHRSGTDPRTLEEVCGMMDRQTQQLISLVDDLLDVSRITRNKLELRLQPLQLHEVVQTAVETVAPLIESRRQQLSIDLPDDAVTIHADPHRLAQILANLLNNSAKYTSEGGHIRIAARIEGDDVLFSVQDDGIGIPPDRQDQIFDLFTQVDSASEGLQAGLGIGLTLVRSLVQLHGGSISVHSAGTGTGSEFLVQLPILDAPVERMPASSPKPSDRPAQRRVLVVDDNEAAASTLSMVVRIFGHQVETAKDGVEAVERAAEFRPDIILMDIGMPRMNGYEAARRIRSQAWGQDILLIALTGWGQEQDRRRSTEAGFDHHLIKPADPTQLQQLLSQ